MKIVLMLFLFAGVMECNCQSLSVVLYGKNVCSGEAEQIMSFGLIKDSIIYSVKDTSGILHLDKPGTYILLYAIGNIDTTQLGKLYEIQKGVFRDTLQLTSIYACMEPTTGISFMGYCCCDEKCEGYQIDYYTNGNKRMEGFFRQGIPYGKLIFYHPNGSMQKVENYPGKGKGRQRR